MSTTLSPRPLPVLPFIAADAGLLLTAGLIAWGTSGELTGGPLLGVVVCVGLGAVLAVLPFVLNDAHQREAALAERQRELAELVNASNAHASRWGTQWAAAATGLQDAAELAGRSLAAAERLPVAFQESAAALTRQLTEIEQQAQARAERAAEQELARTAELSQQFAGQTAALAAHAAQATQTSEHTSALAARENALAGQLATLTGQLSALTAQQAQSATHESARTAREAALADQLSTLAHQLTRVASEVNAEAGTVGAAATEVKTSLLEFARLDASVRAQGTAIAAVLAEFPVAAEQARAARLILTSELAAAPAQLAAEIERRVSDAEVRLSATTAALTARLAEVDSALAGLVAQLHQAVEKAAAAPVVASASPAATELAVVTMATESVAVAAEVAAERVAEAAATPVSVVAVMATAVATTASAPAAAPAPAVSAAKTPVRSDEIMDPFIIPTNGYAALADAMDLGEA